MNRTLAVVRDELGESGGGSSQAAGKGEGEKHFGTFCMSLSSLGNECEGENGHINAHISCCMQGKKNSRSSRRLLVTYTRKG